MKDYTYKYKYFEDGSIIEKNIIIQSENDLEKKQVIQIIQNHILKETGRQHTVIGLMKQ